MRTRLLRTLIAALALIFAACGAGASSSHSSAQAATTLSAPVPRSATVSVSSATHGRPISPGFVGLSIELSAVQRYAGTSPAALNPVFLQLVRNLNPGQSPVLRLGGDSTDLTWWPVPSLPAPIAVRITLTPAWMRVTSAMTRALSARLIPGIDLEAGSIKLAAAEARAFASAMPAGSIAALELGNEPELYAQFTWGRSGKLGRPRPYGPPQYDTDVRKFASGLPPLPLAGPALGAPSWFLKLRQFIASAPRLAVITLHRYPLQECYVPKSSPKFPTIANILAPAATTGEANSVAPYTGLAHAHGLSIRIDEMNTVSCGGAPGVSDAFASALWATDALFEMARVGIDGVNIHTYPGATYALFDFKQVNGKWVGTVKPEYYGLMLFAQAAPPGSRLLATTVSHHGGVKAWATRAPDGSTRVTLINHSTTAQTITLKTASSAPTATVQVLRAPDLAARAGISFAGQSFGSQTTTGTLRGHVQSATLTPTGSHYLVRLPAASEALITIPAG